MSIKTVLEIQTEAITQEDRQKLSTAALRPESPSFPFRVLEYQYGWVVFTYYADPQRPGGMSEDCKDVGMSPAFCRIIDIAEKDGHMMVVFDTDADFVEEEDLLKEQSSDPSNDPIEEMAATLSELTEWMLEHTGPKDGTLEMLIRAQNVIHERNVAVSGVPIPE